MTNAYETQEQFRTTEAAMSLKDDTEGSMDDEEIPTRMLTSKVPRALLGRNRGCFDNRHDRGQGR